MQGSFIPAFGSSSSRPFGSAHFKARREALTRVLTAGFVLPDASGSWSSAALCAHPGLIPIRLSSGALIGRTAPEWADKISRMPGMTKHQTGLRLDAAHLLDFGIAMRAAHLLKDGAKSSLTSSVFPSRRKGLPQCASSERSTVLWER